MSAIAVEHLSKRFATKRAGEVVAVDDVSFDVPAAQVVALLGPNGAGKTTCVEILEGFQTPSAGTVRVLGADPAHGGRAWRARIGLVPQATGLDPQLTPAEIFAAYAAAYPRAMSVAEALEVAGLADVSQVRVGAMSGGQQRRVDVGLGVLGRPELLFLDEPTTGLDPQARQRVWAAVRRLTDTGTTVVLTTHYLDEAQQLADRVIVLVDGAVRADDTPDGLRARGAGPVIRCPLPPGARSSADLAADLPRDLAARVDPDPDELVVRSEDVGRDLTRLVAWAGAHGVDLSRLQVGPPTLEAAYLSLIDAPAEPAEPVPTVEEVLR